MPPISQLGTLNREIFECEDEVSRVPANERYTAHIVRPRLAKQNDVRRRSRVMAVENVISILRVDDLELSRRYYIEKLGFALGLGRGPNDLRVARQHGDYVM